jgi:phospholipid transport system substrate-binding protein
MICETFLTPKIVDHFMTVKFGIITRRFALAAFAVLFMAVSAPAQAADKVRPDADGAATFVSGLANQAIGILKESDAKDEAEKKKVFRELLSQGFDLRVIGRLILGRHWREASKEQRVDYLDLFGDYIIRTYASMLAGYNDETFEVGRARPTGKADMEVDSKIIRPEGPPIPVLWRVRMINDEFRVIDVKVEGVSMVIAKREEFDSVVKNKGMDGLLAALQPRT